MRKETRGEMRLVLSLSAADGVFLDIQDQLNGRLVGARHGSGEGSCSSRGCWLPACIHLGTNERERLALVDEYAI